MIEASTWSASGDPLLADLETACVALRDRVAALRDLMWARFRELVDAAVLTPRDVPAYVDSRSFDTVRGTTAIDVIVEGRSAADPTATLSVDCGDFPATLRVVDAESATELVPTTPGPIGAPHEITLDLGSDTPRVLRVEISVTETTFWSPCTATVSGRRRFRGDSEPIDTAEQGAIGLEDMNWIVGASGIASFSGSLDPGRIAIVEEFARDAGAAVSRLRALQRATSIDADDYEVYQLVLERIILPLADTLLADPQIGGEPMLSPNITAWQAAIRELLVQSAPGHVGAGA